MEVGERIVNLERALNIREFQLTCQDDKLSQRFLKEPLVVPGVDDQGSTVNLDPMLDEYYTLRGWDLLTGRPTPATLKRLHLEDVAQVLKHL